MSKIIDFSKELLKSLAELRQTENFPHLSQLDKCLGAAVRFLGPEIVLCHLPIHFGANQFGAEPTNAFLLPILRQNIIGAPLRHFLVTFMPIARQLGQRLTCDDNLSTIDDKMSMAERRLTETLRGQIWALLPAYCSQPTDAKENLRDLAKIMGG